MNNHLINIIDGLIVAALWHLGSWSYKNREFIWEVMDKNLEKFWYWVDNYFADRAAFRAQWTIYLHRTLCGYEANLTFEEFDKVYWLRHNRTKQLILKMR